MKLEEDNFHLTCFPLVPRSFPQRSLFSKIKEEWLQETMDVNLEKLCYLPSLDMSDFILKIASISAQNEQSSPFILRYHSLVFQNIK